MCWQPVVTCSRAEATATKTTTTAATTTKTTTTAAKTTQTMHLIHVFLIITLKLITFITITISYSL